MEWGQWVNGNSYLGEGSFPEKSDVDTTMNLSVDIPELIANSTTSNPIEINKNTSASDYLNEMKNYIEVTSSAGNWKVEKWKFEPDFTKVGSTSGTVVIKDRYNQNCEIDFSFEILESLIITLSEDVTIYSTQSWRPKDHFISAIDGEGISHDFSEITVILIDQDGVEKEIETLEINNLAPGTYKVKYSYQDSFELLTLSVIEDLTKLEVNKDKYIIYENTPWDNETAFKYATDKDGNNLNFNQIDIEGEVNNLKPGSYVLVYTNNGEYISESVSVTVTVIALQKALVRFVDEEGKDLADCLTLHGKAGEFYESHPVEIEGYALKEFPSNASGVFGPESIEVVYLYTPMKDVALQTALVKFVDEEGKDLADRLTLHGKAGEFYESHPVEIEGYALKEFPSNASGIFGNDSIDIVYLYEKNELIKSNIVKKQVDENLPKTGERIINYSLLASGLVLGFVFLFGITQKKKNN